MPLRIEKLIMAGCSSAILWKLGAPFSNTLASAAFLFLHPSKPASTRPTRFWFEPRHLPCLVGRCWMDPSRRHLYLYYLGRSLRCFPVALHSSSILQRMSYLSLQGVAPTRWPEGSQLHRWVRGKHMWSEEPSLYHVAPRLHVDALFH